MRHGEAGIVVVVAAIFIPLCYSLEVNEACTTPNRQGGTCIPFKQCAALVTLLERQPRPVPPDVLKFLRDSGCGFLGNTPLVCCARTGGGGQVQGGQAPAPVDVSRHRNVRLINSEDCGTSTAERIFNGQKTAVMEYPWMALLGYRMNNQREVKFRCGGSLISERYVLTAAHCISNTNRLKLVSVRLGEHNTNKTIDCDQTSDGEICAPPPLNIDVQNSVVHPDYSATKLINDIALVRLARRVAVSESVRPICLPVGLELQRMNLDSLRLIVAGWGATETGSSSSNDLLKVEVPVVPTAQCAAVYKTQFKYDVNYKQLCAGGSNKAQDSCNGDSGGPLKGTANINGNAHIMQYGVVSYGHRHCGTTGVPGVYTRVGYYMDWILNSMQP